MNLQQRDATVIWHPFTPQKNHPYCIPIVKAKDSLLYDENGNTYVDSISSWWVTLHGHGNEYIAKQVYEQALQLEQVIFAGFTHEPAVALAEQLLPLLPGNFSKVFYSDNGSTSVEVALKMALQYWWNKHLQDNESQLTGDKKKTITRRKILAFTNSYHGDTFGGMSVSHRSIFTKAFDSLLFDVVFIDTPTIENIGEIKATIHQYANELAAFIYEPLVQGAGGMHMYDGYLLNEVLNTCKLLHIICIADEVMTGFGRTGKFFASDYLHKKPDIICLSKGLTGGTMALGVTACTFEIYEAFNSDNKLKTFFHGHSFTANPLACRAALASLHLLTEPFTISAIESITEQIQLFSNELKNTSSPKIKNLRCLGTILAFEFETEVHNYLNSLALQVTQLALQHGVYLRPLGNTVYIMPPYCISSVELNKVFDFLRKLLTVSF